MNFCCSWMAVLTSVNCSALIPVTAGCHLPSRLFAVAGATASTRSIAGAAAAAAAETPLDSPAPAVDTVLVCSQDSVAKPLLSEVAIFALPLLAAKPNPLVLLGVVAVALTGTAREADGPATALAVAPLTVDAPPVFPFAPPASASNSSNGANRAALIRRSNPIS